jgi:hypothetical protein
MVTKGGDYYEGVCRQTKVDQSWNLARDTFGL